MQNGKHTLLKNPKINPELNSILTIEKTRCQGQNCFQQKRVIQLGH